MTKRWRGGYTIPELAEFLGVTVADVRDWIARGRIIPPAPANRGYYRHYDAIEVERIEDWYSDCLKREAEGCEPCESMSF